MGSIIKSQISMSSNGLYQASELTRKLPIPKLYAGKFANLSERKSRNYTLFHLHSGDTQRHYHDFQIADKYLGVTNIDKFHSKGISFNLFEDYAHNLLWEHAFGGHVPNDSYRQTLVDLIYIFSSAEKYKDEEPEKVSHFIHKTVNDISAGLVNYLESLEKDRVKPDYEHIIGRKYFQGLNKESQEITKDNIQGYFQEKIYQVIALLELISDLFPRNYLLKDILGSDSIIDNSEVKKDRKRIDSLKKHQILAIYEATEKREQGFNNDIKKNMRNFVIDRSPKFAEQIKKYEDLDKKMAESYL